jgi:hypothetical protein
MLRRPSTAKLVTIIAVLAVAAGGAVAVTRTSVFRSRAAPAAPAPPPPIGIVAASVQSHDVPIYLRGVGTVIAYNNVLLRSQINGELVKISFHQGQQVKKGDVLAVIDPRPYQAQLDSLRREMLRNRQSPKYRRPRVSTNQFFADLALFASTEPLCRAAETDPEVASLLEVHPRNADGAIFTRPSTRMTKCSSGRSAAIALFMRYPTTPPQYVTTECAAGAFPTYAERKLSRVENARVYFFSGGRISWTQT